VLTEQSGPMKPNLAGKRENMRRLFKLNAAPIAALGALIAVAIAAPTSARAGAYCRRDYSYGLQKDQLHCGFDTMAQCQAMNSGRDGDCLRDPFQGWVNGAYAYAPGYSPSQGRRDHLKTTIESR
jgi:hypothetical protein